MSATPSLELHVSHRGPCTVDNIPRMASQARAHDFLWPRLVLFVHRHTALKHVHPITNSDDQSSTAQDWQAVLSRKCPPCHANGTNRVQGCLGLLLFFTPLSRSSQEKQSRQMRRCGVHMVTNGAEDVFSWSLIRSSCCFKERVASQAASSLER